MSLSEHAGLGWPRPTAVEEDCCPVGCWRGGGADEAKAATTHHMLVSHDDMHTDNKTGRLSVAIVNSNAWSAARLLVRSSIAAGWEQAVQKVVCGQGCCCWAGMADDSSASLNDRDCQMLAALLVQMVT